MNIEGIREVFRRGLRFYLVYIFIFTIILFAIQKPKKNLGQSIDNPNKRINKNKDRVQLIESGKEGALARINLIQNAEKSLDITYYSWQEGKTTEIFIASIIDAADRGVEVRILLDGIFHNLKKDLRDTIYGFKTHPNIELKFYKPFKLLSPWTWNNRLHDKLILVDDSLGLIGGRNIGDRYFVEDVDKLDYAKDRDVLIYNENKGESTDSAVGDMKVYYEKIWNHEYSKPSLKRLKTKQELKGKIFKEDLRNRYVDFKREYAEDTKEIDWHENTIATDGVRFVHNPLGKVNNEPWCLEELLILAEEAQEYIFIQSPYVIPSREMKTKFKKYQVDLTKANMLTNSQYSSPNVLAMSGYFNNRKSIVDSGVQLYEYQSTNSLHGKTYIFDDAISAVGSFNLDARSSYINSESMVIISSKEFTDKLKNNIQVDLDNSLRVDRDYSYVNDDSVEEGNVSIFKRIITKILSKISLFLDYLL